MPPIIRHTSIVIKREVIMSFCRIVKIIIAVVTKVATVIIYVVSKVYTVKIYIITDVMSKVVN
jgi:hypothetical protein